VIIGYELNSNLSSSSVSKTDWLYPDDSNVSFLCASISHAYSSWIYCCAKRERERKRKRKRKVAPRHTQTGLQPLHKSQWNACLIILAGTRVIATGVSVFTRADLPGRLVAEHYCRVCVCAFSFLFFFSFFLSRRRSRVSHFSFQLHELHPQSRRTSVLFATGNGRPDMGVMHSVVLKAYYTLNAELYVFICVNGSRWSWPEPASRLPLRLTWRCTVVPIVRIIFKIDDNSLRSLIGV